MDFIAEHSVEIILGISIALAISATLYTLLPDKAWFWIDKHVFD